MKQNISLNNLEQFFPQNFTLEKKAQAQTLFLKKLALKSHDFYKGKIMTLPKAGIWGYNWLNVWYTPGVSAISQAIKKEPSFSFDFSNRGNYVAVVSDSTRVLGDGDCGPSGGLGVMEGKAMLMKYLGGVDATALCIDSRDKDKKHSAKKIIDFVKMVEPSFGAINLEDISQPNCYEVLDTLREECSIPVWHDDAQGTGCVTLAGLINALKVANKKIEDVKIVFLGSGAANTTIASLIMQAGGDAKNMILFDSKGSLNKERKDLKEKTAYYKKWELCCSTNPDMIESIEEACKGADVLIALSKPGPNTVKAEWIKSMNKDSIVFVCANPIPEIYPYAAKEAGALIVATGRGDFPNQVNNSLGFPGILKGALMVRAKKISDKMAIKAAYAIAEVAQEEGLDQDRIMPTMENVAVFAKVAAAVSKCAIDEGLARINIEEETVYKKTLEDIMQTRNILDELYGKAFIKEPPQEMIDTCLNEVIQELETIS